MNLKELASRPKFMQLSMRASQAVPVWAGHRLVWWMSGMVSRVRPAAYHIVQANLRQVLGTETDRSTLDETTRRIFHTTIRGYYHLYRALALPRSELQRAVDVPADTQSMLGALWDRKQGTILVFPHLGNFDLGGQVLASLVPEMQLLTLPNPSPGFEMINELRRKSGVQVTPLSTAALRQAIQLLRRGGVLAIAGDRPVSELDPPIPFFGRPARLPSGHVRLASKTGATIRILYCVYSPEIRKYVLRLGPPVELIDSKNGEEAVQVNTRRVLDALEVVIRRWVGQWQMYEPVWPEPLQV